MRILFVWPHYIQAEVPLGLLYLSAIAKSSGHQTDMFCLNPFPWYGEGQARTRTVIRKGFLEKLKNFAPDLLAFSVVSTGLSLSLDLAHLAKQKRNIPVIFGGAHPTVDPKGTIRKDAVDMICIGEGEYAFLELVTQLDMDGGITHIQNIWVKKKGKIYRNGIRPLITDLDFLPYPDREILPIPYLDRRFKGASFLTSRGCPYQCSYCINACLQEMYRNRGPFVRYRNINSVIDEIKLYCRTASPEELIFSDEVFTLNKKRIVEFCSIYKKEIALPFRCQTRADLVDEQTATALKDAGCNLVSFGVESGNDYIRTSTLNKKVTTEAICKAFRILRSKGVKTGSFNMIGAPSETEKTIWETINLNRKIRPNFVQCSILMPHQGTRIREIFEKENLLKGKTLLGDHYTTCIQELPTISSRKLLVYQRLFDLYVYANQNHIPLLHLLKFMWSQLPEGDRFYHRALRYIPNRLYNLTRKSIRPERWQYCTRL